MGKLPHAPVAIRPRHNSDILLERTEDTHPGPESGPGTLLPSYQISPSKDFQVPYLSLESAPKALKSKRKASPRAA